MGLESGTFVDDLVTTNPPGGDDKRQGDDHLRLIKTVLKNTIKRGTKAIYLPGVVTKSANYTVLDTDESLTFVCDTTAGAFTLTLPTLDSTRHGWTIKIIKTNTGVNPVFIAPPSGTINGYTKVRRSIQNAVTEVEWIGSWVASRPNGGAPVGSVMEYYGSTLPNGHLWADGAAYSTTNYVELFAALAFATAPDRRGRVGLGRDNMGVGAAGRIGTFIGGTVLTAPGGVESVGLTIAELPSHTHLVSGATLTENQAITIAGSGTTQTTGFSNQTLDHTHSYTSALGGVTTVSNTPLTTNVSSVEAAGQATGGTSVSIDHTHNFTASVTGSVTANHTHNISFNSQPTGSGSFHNNLPPSIICNAIVVAE
jgi:microcystin-dependent protein